MTKEILITPAWDKRHKDPDKNYGIHGAEMFFVLKGKHGAITFCVYTNWHLPHVDKELRNAHRHDSRYDFMFRPVGADISYHAHKAQCEGQEPMSECKWLDNQPCYCDGSSLDAQPICALLIAEGSDAVWKHLEGVYTHRFGTLE